MTILIVAGGKVSEREISLSSAKNVMEALKSRGHVIELFDFQEGLEKLEGLLSRFDVIFPVLHGREGEDGTLYRFLKDHNARYVGSDPEGANIAFNKILFKHFCKTHEIATAPWSRAESNEDVLAFGLPLALKAAEGGSSLEVALIKEAGDLATPHAQHVLNETGEVFVERLVKGTEITVGILNDVALPVFEIRSPTDGWFDFTNKYSGESVEIPFAPSVAKEIQEEAQRIALFVHQKLNLGQYSRSDFIVEDGIPIILEVNTPGGVGMTSQSLFPKAAQAINLSFGEMLEQIIQ